jgi:hypothetical protein
MNNRQRAKFIALEDFKHKAVMGIGHINFSYEKGDILNLRINGRMALDLIAKGLIKRLFVE